MRALIQRVSSASVLVEYQTVGQIGHGILTLLGVEKGDNEETLQKLIQKILALRIFEDAEGKMNKSVKDVGGEHLIVSQFTLLGDCRKGNRPSFIRAAPPEEAKLLYLKGLELSQSLGVPTQSGRFQAAMQVQSVNAGPVTFLVET